MVDHGSGSLSGSFGLDEIVNNAKVNVHRIPLGSGQIHQG
jgi:hypothetical protein